MKTSKEMMMESFSEAIKNCNTMIEFGSKTSASFYRGIAQGLATAMYFSDLITNAEYTGLCVIIRDTFK